MKMKSITAAAVLAACGLAAQAQTPPPPAPGAAPHMQMQMPGGAAMHERMQEHMQQRLQRRMESLKRILQISPAQDGAWNNWVAAMRPDPRSMEQRHRMREEFSRLSTSVRLVRLCVLRSLCFVLLVRRADATTAFYAQLTPPQQKAFDEVALKFMRGRHGHGGHRM